MHNNKLPIYYHNHLYSWIPVIEISQEWPKKLLSTLDSPLFSLNCILSEGSGMSIQYTIGYQFKIVEAKHILDAWIITNWMTCREGPKIQFLMSAAQIPKKYLHEQVNIWIDFFF